MLLPTSLSLFAQSASNLNSSIVLSLVDPKERNNDVPTCHPQTHGKYPFNFQLCPSFDRQIRKACILGRHTSFLV